MYITYVYCAIIEPRLWNIVPGGNREWWAAPPGAAHRSYNPAFGSWLLNDSQQTKYPKFNNIKKIAHLMSKSSYDMEQQQQQKYTLLTES